MREHLVLVILTAIATVLGIVFHAQLARLWNVTGAWMKGLLAEFRRDERHNERQELEVLRGQVAQVALDLGIRLPVSRAGEVVTFNDGSKATYIADAARYRRLMQSRAVTVTTTHRAQPPRTLQEFSRSELEDWLRHHC